MEYQAGKDLKAHVVLPFMAKPGVDKPAPAPEQLNLHNAGDSTTAWGDYSNA